MSAVVLVPVMALADRAGLFDLVGEHVCLTKPGGCNAPVKVSALVAGMVAGADSIDLCRPRDYADIRRHVFPEALVGLGFRCGHKGRWSA